ncbi:MAG: hypothetical protein N3D77_16190, partial [Geminicoccaceae bacterium]|nr:hypothetical protein [Geminicoccaceae bacterium]
MRLPERAARQSQPCDRGDRGQRLAAKAERGHPFQFLQRAQLAGGVARERQRQLFGGNAAAVVVD